MMYNLDDLDVKILGVVQKKSNQTHAQIGAIVGLSSSAVRRRLERLKRDDVIQAEIMIVDADRFGVTIIADVEFQYETPEIYKDFEKQMDAETAVQQCYYVAGDTDYLVVIHGRSLKWYEEWSRDVFMANPNIRRYSSRVVWSRKKFAPEVSSFRF